MYSYVISFGNWMIRLLFAIVIIGAIYTGILFRKKSRDLSGRPPLTPIVSSIGKFSMWGTWVAMIIQSFRINLRLTPMPPAVGLVALVLAGIGFILFFVSYLNMGDALRVGLPRERTTLKTGGIYRFSRNPMYVAFYLLAVSSTLYTLNPLVLALAAIGIFVHHRMVIAEEKFLRGRFGRAYSDYCKETRRYL